MASVPRPAPITELAQRARVGIVVDQAGQVQIRVDPRRK